MKTSTLKKAPAILLSIFGILPLLRTEGAGLSVVVTPAHSSAADTTYPGSQSTVTRAEDRQTGLSFLVAGRDYGVDPAPGRPRWGLRTGEMPGNSAKRGFVITNGFAPAAAGSRVDRSGNNASYISIAVGNVQPGTLFQNVSIDFDGLVFTRATNAWAAASSGGFNNWSVARQTNAGANGRQVSVSLPDFTWTGAEPLEFRVYGITGTDEGAFASLRITAGIITPGVPEPTTFVLGLVALAWFHRRHR